MSQLLSGPNPMECTGAQYDASVWSTGAGRSRRTCARAEQQRGVAYTPEIES